MGEIRETRHSKSRKHTPLLLDENGLYWNGKFWPKEPNEVISRRMASIKSNTRQLLADSEREFEGFWIESTQKDIWSIIYQKNLDQLDQSITMDEQLANLRQKQELGRLRSFTFEVSLGKEILEKREKCEQRRRNFGDHMEMIIQRSARIRDKRRSFVINTQEDEIIGLLIVNPLHEKMETVQEEDDDSGSGQGANAATINRKKREKEKKARPMTIAPSMPNLLTEINFITDEVVEGCQSIQKQEEEQVNDAVLGNYIDAITNVLIFGRALVRSGEMIILGGHSSGLPVQTEDKQRDIQRVGGELSTMIDRMVTLARKLVGVYKEFKKLQNPSEEKVDRLKKKIEDNTRLLRSTALLIHKFTEEYTGITLSAEM